VYFFWTVPHVAKVWGEASLREETIFFLVFAEKVEKQRLAANMPVICASIVGIRQMFVFSKDNEFERTERAGTSSGLGDIVSEAGATHARTILSLEDEYPCSRKQYFFE